ncbi:MAG: TniQ family protein [Burkholderiales bacterium]|nr:TniQ family protein [Burkholderiales bacterium]
MRRFSYIPELLPDELLYSWLARLAALNAYHHPREFLLAIVGSSNAVLSVDLPTLLDSMHRRLGDMFPFSTPIDAIQRGTLYPYHRPFISPDRNEAIVQMLLHEGGKGLKTLLGRVANRFGASQPLRYCPACFEADYTRFGVPYWRRVHQLPGVICCVIHATRLLDHELPSTTAHKQRLIPPAFELGKHSVIHIASKNQIKLAILSIDLLKAALPPLAGDVRALVYGKAAKDRGLVNSRGRVCHGQIVGAIRKRFNDFSGFEHRARLLASAAQPLRWVADIFNRPERAVHPLCHLLLIDLLWDGVDEFSKAILEVTNGNCEPKVDAGSKVISPARFSKHDRGMSQILQDTSISCRSAAELLGMSVTTVVNRRRALGIPISERRKLLDGEKISAINTSLGRGYALVTIAHRHNVSLSTVYRLLSQDASLLAARNRTEHKQVRARQREHWLKALNRKKSDGVNHARKIAADSYAWLYRNDRPWLMQINKQFRVPCKRIARVDWSKRDDKLCQALSRFIKQFFGNRPRLRLSKTMMLRQLGETNVRAHWSKLPRLASMIEGHAESILDFQKRRIDWAIDALKRDSVSLPLWRIQRAAGLKTWSPSLRAYARQRLT